MIRFGVVLCALSLLIRTTTATDFELLWSDALYGGIIANPGDTVTFTYGPNSDLWIHPTGSCEQSGRVQLGGFGPGTSTYNFTQSDIGSPVTFATSVEDNCANGQIITFTVAYPTIVGATKFDLSWFVAAYGGIDAFPGDSVTFKYDEFSDVWIHPSGDCTQDGSIFVGPIGPATVSYRFTEADAGKVITFTSSVSDNCLQGQIINITVAGRPSPPTIVPLTPAPSIAPQTAAPILAPVRPLPTVAPVIQPTLSPVVSPPAASPTMSPVEPPVAGPPTPVDGTPTTAPIDAPTPVVAPTTPSPPVDTPTAPVDTPTAPVDAPTAPVDTPTPPVDTPTPP
ncbi:MAG: hypothetical protein SGBAC_004114, partial [Bacillariaceae sp.]